MMICENCEKEMQGSVLRCSHCGHNHVLQRIDSWREKRNHHLSSLNTQRQPARPQPPQPPAASSLRASAKDSTLIRFPKRPVQASESVAPTVTENIESLPEWRQRLDARLREIREQRTLEMEPPPIKREEPHLDRNPIVASALNRIQRANYLQPIRSQSHSRYAVAAELAPEPQIEVPGITAQPVNRLAEPRTATAPAISRTMGSAQPVLESLIEPDLPIEEIHEEDILAEVMNEPPPKVEEKAEAHSGITILEAASLAKRAAAAVIDAEIIAFSMLPLFAAYFFLGGWFETPAIYAPIVIGILLITAYYFVTYALAGRTMGMAFMNLHLASQSSSTDLNNPSGPSTVTFTFQQAALRAMGGTISLLLFPVNVFFIAKSYDRLSLSDSLSGTQVVRIKK
ncbi:MAG: RDD family protein [Acidobacteria bacterium]|nr:RDD family protein [Acidobacteriota bacterium]